VVGGVHIKYPVLGRFVFVFALFRTEGPVHYVDSLVCLDPSFKNPTSKIPRPARQVCRTVPGTRR
jgi:hypothetical protein